MKSNVQPAANHCPAPTAGAQLSPRRRLCFPGSHPEARRGTPQDFWPPRSRVPPTPALPVPPEPGVPGSHQVRSSVEGSVPSPAATSADGLAHLGKMHPWRALARETLHCHRPALITCHRYKFPLPCTVTSTGSPRKPETQTVRAGERAVGGGSAHGPGHVRR